MPLLTELEGMMPGRVKQGSGAEGREGQYKDVILSWSPLSETNPSRHPRKA